MNLRARVAVSVLLSVGWACGDDASGGADAGGSERDASTANDSGVEPRDGGRGGKVEQLIAPEELPISENGVYTSDGRFFVVGGTRLYEIEATGSGYEANELLNEACTLGGVVEREALLYAVCLTSTVPGDGGSAFAEVTRAELLRIDPSGGGAPSVRRVDIVDDPLPQLNGMEFGPDGALYLSNTSSAFVGGPAVYRVELVSEDPLSVETRTFLAMSSAFTVPNGLRSDGEALYFAGGQTLVKVAVNDDGTPGAQQTVYEVPGSLLTGGLVDDFDLDAKRIYMARNDAEDLSAVQRGEDDPDVTSRLVLTDLDGGNVQELDLDFIPSSTAAPRAGLFDANSVVVTSFFNGGLYQVTVPEP